jgi:hypothetical protein
MLGVLLRLIKLLILHKHDSNGKIEQEETANYDTKDKVHNYKPGCIGVLENVHDLSPPFHGDALKNS